MSRRYPHTPLPFSKPCDVTEDAATLDPYYQWIDRVSDALAGQHPIRRWEYGMALYTIDRWRTARAVSQHLPQGTLLPLVEVCDVGGAGSHWWKVLQPLARGPVLLVDTAAPDRVWRDGEPVQYWKESIETFAGHAGHDQFDVLTAISVVEHVPQVRPFLRACRMLLKPGGLLFLTTDFWGAEGPDVAHFHWMRERIYNAERIRKLLCDARELGFKSFGTSDWAYPGPMVFDYSVASAALVKKD